MWKIYFKIFQFSNLLDKHLIWTTGFILRNNFFEMMVALWHLTLNHEVNVTLLDKYSNIFLVFHQDCQWKYHHSFEWIYWEDNSTNWASQYNNQKNFTLLDRLIGYKKLLFLKYVYRQEILMHKSLISINHLKLAPIVGKLMLTAQNWEIFPWFLRPPKVGSGACD